MKSFDCPKCGHRLQVIKFANETKGQWTCPDCGWRKEAKAGILEKHSTTGTRWDNGQATEFDRITIEPTRDTIAACNCCGRANYDRKVRESVVPTGLKLFDLGITSNGCQISVTKLCPDCIKDLRSKLFKFSA